MAVISRSLIVFALALSAFAASVTEPVAATRVARGGGNDGNGGGPYGPGDGPGDGGHDGPGNGNGDGSHGGGGGGPGGEPYHPQPSHRPPPRPSRRALNTLYGTQIADEICPGSSYGCPVSLAGSLTSLPNGLDDWINQGFYCIDRTADLTDCGGCAALDAKHDCTRITGTKSVSCVAGSCVVDSCLQNFTLDNNSCTSN